MSRKSITSRGKLFGRNTVLMEDRSPYMTRYWFGRLRLHIFYRGDLDPDAHDHPWPFWTFPLTSYVEEVTVRKTPFPAPVIETENGLQFGPIDYEIRPQIVRAWRLHYRPAEHCHRVLGRYAGVLYKWDDETCPLPAWLGVGAVARGNAVPVTNEKKIVTIVWRGRTERNWGFLKNRDGKWCWVAFKDYLFQGGKNAPCE